MFVSCPQTSLIDFKEFNMPVVTPHEFFMALEPELFPWESRVLTDFTRLLPTLRKQPETLEEALAKLSTDES